MVLRVEIDGRPWLADAGFGGLGLLTPIALDTEAEQGDPREPRRLLRRGRILVHQFRIGTEWSDVYHFTLDEIAPVDLELGNWFTSAHPTSRFRQSLVVALADADRRFAIQNREFTIRPAGGAAEKREIATPDELLALLSRYFGLNFPPGTRFGSPGSPWPS
jgi:N-hydroxyarylamine O-acetyltransferase